MKLGNIDWISARIGDKCLVGDGAHASIKRKSEGIMYVTSKNFKEGGLDLTKIDYISEEDFAKHFRDNAKALTKPKSGDILFSIIGSIGEPYLVKKHDIFGMSSSVAILRPNFPDINPEYLYYWLRGDIFQNALYGIKGGVAQSYVSLEMIRSLPLNFPPILFQQKIAFILSAYDDLIENNLKQIKILEEMAQMMYREWFVNSRFPGHKKVKMVKSEMGLIPEGWQVKGLFDVAEITYGFPFKSKLFSTERDNKRPVIRIRDILNSDTATFTPEAAQDKYLVSNGDILVGMDGDFHMGKWSGGEAFLNQRVCRIKPLNGLPYYFLFLALRTPIQNLNASIVGTTVAHLGDSHLRQIRIITPTDQLLSEARELLDPIYNLEIELKLKIRNLRKTRDLLLPKLISGEINIENLHIHIGNSR